MATERYELKVSEVPFATNGLSAPTIYAEHIRGAMFNGTTAKLNLVENKIDAVTSEIKAVHVATIVLPVDQVKAWADFLQNLLDQQPSDDKNGDAA